MRYLQAGASALGGVVGGVLTTAFINAGLALIDWVTKADTAKEKINDLIDKLKEHAEATDLARQAGDKFKLTEEGITFALREAEKARKQATEGMRSYGEQANIEAQANLKRIDRIYGVTQALLEQAKAEAAAANSQTFGAAGGAGAAAAQSIYADRVEEIEKALAKLKAARAGFFAELNASRADLAEESAKRAVDPIAKLNRQYDLEVQAAKKAAIANGEVTNSLTKQIQAIELRRKAAIKAAQDAARVDNSNQQSGRQINEAQARAIVASIGGTVTSGTRSAQHNKDVGGVPNSFHVKGQAVDIAKTAGITLGKIVKAFEKAGVHLIEKLDEGDHFHIAFGRRGPAGPSAETLAKRAQAAADSEERRRQAYENELANLQGQEIEARQALVTGADEIAQLELLAIEVSRQKYADNVRSLVDQRKLLGDEAAELLKLNEERAKLRTELVQRREAERKFRMAEADARRDVNFQIGSKGVQEELLQSQAGLAKTVKDRRDLERKLLDLQFEMERIQLQAIIAEYERLKIKKDLTDVERQELADKKVQADLARERLATQPERQANAQAGNDQANASPLESWADDVPQTAAQINEALEHIAANGLDHLADGLTEVLMGTKKLKDAFREVAASVVSDIVKMIVKMLILKALTAIFGGFSGGGRIGGGSPKFSPSNPGVGYALGGRIFGPGGPTDDRVPIMASPDEFMVNARSAKRVGYGALAYINQTGELPPHFAGGGGIRAIRPSNAAAVAPGGRSGTDLSDAAVAKLGGIVNDAIRAMPPVNLFPTYDPVAAMEAALNTKDGRAVMARFMGENQSSLGGVQ